MPYEFTFDNCAAAIEAHRARLPRVVKGVKAIAIAELEARGGYDEADHGPFFERYDENALNADDLAQFPDYLVCIPVDRNDAPENAALMEQFSFSATPEFYLVDKQGRIIGAWDDWVEEEDLSRAFEQALNQTGE